MILFVGSIFEVGDIEIFRSLSTALDASLRLICNFIGLVLEVWIL